MKWNPKSFGMRLWLCFVAFATSIFAALWLLQTVLLQSFYNRMAIHNVKQVAVQIAQAAEELEGEALQESLDCFASGYSLLIFLTDWQGKLYYSADEHSSVYEKHLEQRTEEGRKENPYRNQEQMMNWEIGAFRNLPQDYSVFLEQLAVSENGTVGYTTENEEAYVYGMALKAPGQSGGEEAVLYISMQLGAVGAAAGILRIQLIWVTLASLVIGFVIAYFFSRQFSGPVSAISEQARRMARGEFGGDYKKGFCQELDELSDTLGETAAALEQLENARRELLANVSHDLRTPLTMMKGYAEMVRDISWEDDEMREQDLAVIIRETDRLTDLVNDILEYSSIHGRESAAELSVFDLSAAAEAAAGQFVPLCRQKGCRMEVQIEPGLLVKGEEKQLNRVFYNLIDNAVRHSGADPRVQILVKGTDRVVRAEIRDYGEGIPKEELSSIWDRYFTARQQRNRGGGSGLGLAIVKEILLAQKAEFGVDSEIGQGCTFWFEMEREA